MVWHERYPISLIYCVDMPSHHLPPVHISDYRGGGESTHTGHTEKKQLDIKKRHSADIYSQIRLRQLKITPTIHSILEVASHTINQLYQALALPLHTIPTSSQAAESRYVLQLPGRTQLIT